MKNLSALVLMGFLVGCAAGAPGPQHDHEHTGFTKHYQGSQFEVTDKGLFSVEMVFADHELRTGVNKVDIIIHDRNDEDVWGAEISVTPWMPEMGHGVYEAPVVTEKGGGRYAVENIILTMSGRWQLKLAVKKRDQQDAVVFDFPNVPVDTRHEHKAIAAPADLDLSTEVMSENKTFRLSYQSLVDPIPLNKIHSWKLRLTTADGQPVRGAVISLDGDMPEHGHGLPTAPEVTEDLGNGEYRVEGVQFSMPGWWVMRFKVRAEGKLDTATFNLLLTE